MWLFLIFVAVPIIEIALFIQVGGFLGLWPTLAIVIATAFIGTTLLRSQGVTALGNLQNSLSAGQNPMDHFVHGLLIVVAGVVLLTPGFFTDAVGLLLLLPPVRAALIKMGADRFANNIHIQTGGMHPNQTTEPQQSETVEADYVVLDDEDAKPGSSGWTKDSNHKE